MRCTSHLRIRQRVRIHEQAEHAEPKAEQGGMKTGGMAEAKVADK